MSLFFPISNTPGVKMAPEVRKKEGATCDNTWLDGEKVSTEASCGGGMGGNTPATTLYPRLNNLARFSTPLEVHSFCDRILGRLAIGGLILCRAL